MDYQVEITYFRFKKLFQIFITFNIEYVLRYFIYNLTIEPVLRGS